MASISHNKKTGRRIIQFIDGDKKRKSIRLGKVQQRQAEAVRVKVEDLVQAKITGTTPTDETSRWLAGLDDLLYSRLAHTGLTQPRESVGLLAFIDRYIADRTDVKPNTRRNFLAARRWLARYFDADRNRANRNLRDVTPGDADAFRVYMDREGLADNSARSIIKRARHFYKVAIRRELVKANPFEGIAASVKANPDRFHYVSREDIGRVLEACPDVEWRLIVALARFGGLRCPSEILALRWTDVDWERDRIRVPSPKTEHLEGGASRIIPLFPELLAYLREAFEEAEPGTEYVIARYRNQSANLRTRLLRIIQRAGLEPWPKLFQNLRSTRETELAETFPIHVVCRWIGNSEPVAAKHYLQLTDEHFERAVAPEAVQNPVQHPAEPGRRVSQDAQTDNALSCEDSRAYESVPVGAVTGETDGIPPRGVEPLCKSSTNGMDSNNPGAESGAVDPDSPPQPPTDPDLADVIQAWPGLPEAVKAGITAMVKASKGE